jgi:hypothetical protein
MTKPTNLSGEAITELQADYAKQELLQLAHEKAKERGCSLLVAMGLVIADLEQKVRNEDSLRER